MDRPAIKFFTPADNKDPLIRAMSDWPDAWDEQLRELLPTVTNHQIAKRLGATAGLVGFRIQKLGLIRTPEQHEALYGNLRGRLVSGMNVANQQQPGTCKWIHKHPDRPSEKPEWWIFLGKGERMPLRRYLWRSWVGPIPKGHNVCFADYNSKRCTLDNLICISNSEMAGRNRNLIKQGISLRALYKTPEGHRIKQKRIAAMRSYWRSEEGQASIARKVENMKQLYAEDLINNPFRRLDDKVVAYYLSQDADVRECIVAERPELIELKRTELLLRRTVKSTEANESKTAN